MVITISNVIDFLSWITKLVTGVFHGFLFFSSTLFHALYPVLTFVTIHARQLGVRVARLSVISYRVLVGVCLLRLPFVEAAGRQMNGYKP